MMKPDTGIAATRIRYARMGQAMGTLHVPDKSTAIVTALDKLGARLAFERTGTRLYEALISKLDAYGGFDGGPSRDELVAIRDEEHHHALLVQETIKTLDGDPTIVTPSANLQAIAGRGLVDVLTDPRTTFVDGLDAIVVAELVDRESWEGLIPVLTAASVTKATLTKIEHAMKTEEEHLTKVRIWIAAARASSADTSE